MNWQLLTDYRGLRTFALVLEDGDDVLPLLQNFAEEQGLCASSFSAVGAFREATLGWFDWDTKDYEKIGIHEQVEVLSFLGDVALEEERRKVHAHVVLGLRGGHTRGGHLLRGIVRPTLEIFLQENAGTLRRAYDPHAQISLIAPRHG